MPDFINMKTAAERLGCSAAYVRTLELDGILPKAIRPGRWYTNRDGVARYRGLSLFPADKFNLAVERLKRRTRFNHAKTTTPQGCDNGFFATG